MNLNVGYLKHSQQRVSINLLKEINDSKQKKKREIDLNIKERIDQS